MTPHQIRLVRLSWQRLMPVADQLGALFYTRLFDIDPSLKRLFARDMKSQGRKLMVVLNTAVVHLENPGSILPAIEELGRRHVEYGVESGHYDTVGEALLWTLGQGLGAAEFTPELRQAWAETYATIAGAMIAAGEETRAGPRTIRAAS